MLAVFTSAHGAHELCIGSVKCSIVECASEH